MEATVYNQKGDVAKTLTLPSELFGLPWNSDLVHQVAVSMASSARNPIAHAKTRGEVRGGGKKPWQQKGTGRARHGSTRSPIWVGGGTTHGPRNDKNYDRKVNRKMKAKALFTILSRKFRDGEVFFLDTFTAKDNKTREASAILLNLKKTKGFPLLTKKSSNDLYVAFAGHDEGAFKSLRNIGSVNADDIRNINPLSLLKYRAILIVNPEESFKVLVAKTGVGAALETGESKVKKVRTKKAAPKAKAKKPAKAK